ncbi:MAG TPA: LysR substrate-binding domain-containing protein [Nevskiaceae bacterium]|nr:LysR substrate-binding domain-containing protein [Nevskiaceae bacterium]
MKLELRHLRYFVAVAEELHFGRAAERLGLSQPPLSQQIRQLEALLGARLFSRTNRRVALTEAGRALLPEAQTILARVATATALVQRTARGELGTLSVGMTRSTPLSGHIPRAILAFRRRYPGIHLTLRELNSLQQVAALQERALQVAILRVDALPEDLVARYLFDDPLVVVMPADHPSLAGLAADASLTVAQLATEDFVLFERDAGAGIRLRIVELCRRAGFSPQVAQEARESPTIVGLVAAGMGVSILPASSAHIHVEGVRYVRLADPQAASGIQVAWRRDDHSPAVSHFVELLAAASH